MWKHYSAYFDKDQKIPEKYRLFLCQEFSEKSDKLFKHESQNIVELLNIALWHIKK